MPVQAPTPPNRRPPSQGPAAERKIQLNLNVIGRAGEVSSGEQNLENERKVTDKSEGRRSNKRNYGSKIKSVSEESSGR